MSERIWTILGYDSGAQVFEQAVPVDAIAESDVKSLLRRLVARHWTEEQTVLASLSSDHRVDLLEVSELSDGPFGFTTDQTKPRYYTAILGDVPDTEDDEDADDLDTDTAED